MHRIDGFLTELCEVGGEGGEGIVSAVHFVSVGWIIVSDAVTGEVGD